MPSRVALTCTTSPASSAMSGAGSIERPARVTAAATHPAPSRRSATVRAAHAAGTTTS